MSAVTTDDVLSHVATDRSVYDLQELIDEEEAWLARRIGPLVGPRTELFRLPSGYDILRLRRPTDAIIAATDNDVEVDVADLELRHNGWRVTRASGIWLGNVGLTYTPNDWYEVRRVVIDLVRGSIALAEQKAGETAYDSERIGEYSYVRATGGRAPQAMRRGIMSSLLPPKEPSSSKLLASFAFQVADRREVIFW